LKPERWGSPLVQEKYQEENTCDKRHPYLIIIIIIIIINTFPWLSRGDLKAETESDIIAAQDQVLQTKYSIT